ncbi:MAG: UDP-N-acetylglucosamine--N-acetylmuramyl-(pentapeptide) pyrophosphoryl-undecaprenol N-acetylglucosamine transferase [Candidatus Omnitrophica bacterium]|nr:UDP-N-acetylglucosamine--N-acetylmuramyl-(pentapeptide) pyrophosphoryl-undecaprenol N-acetylglucosamine transferase [Candidatus Omnitrophota bacterium]
MDKPIVLVGGGSAGHLFPAMCVAETILMLDSRARVIFVCSDNEPCNGYLRKRAEELDRLILHAVQFGRVDSSRPLTYLGSIMRYFAQFPRIFRLMKQLSPGTTVGFGGYQSFLPVVCSRMLGARTVIHEQNVTFGRANRMLVPFADMVAVSFPETQTFLSKGRITLTGNPIRRFSAKARQQREAVAASREKFGLTPDCFTIAVMGGSKGSSFINRLFVATAGLLEERNRRFQVLHLAGTVDAARVNSESRDLRCRYCVRDFIDNMEDVFLSADLVIGRAGATTIAELSCFGLPAILIAYPYASSHQAANARLLERAGAALVLEQHRATPERLADMIADTVDEEGLLERLSAHIRRFTYDDAGQRLAERILQLHTGEL